MPSPCPGCRLQKKKVYFNIDRARDEAKELAIKHEQTFAIFKEGKAVAYSDYATAIAAGRVIIEVVSRYPQVL